MGVLSTPRMVSTTARYITPFESASRSFSCSVLNRPE